MAGFPNIPNSSGYRDNDDPVVLTSGVLDEGVGIVTKELLDRTPVWNVGTGNAGVASLLIFPEGWHSVAIDFVWVLRGPNGGDVILRSDLDLLSNTTDPGAVSQVTVAGPAEDVVTTTTIAADVSVTSGVLYVTEVVRLGDVAGDTSTDAVAFLAVVFRRAS